MKNNNVTSLTPFIFNCKTFTEILLSLQKKIKDLEKRIEELEFENVENSFKLCRENCFSGPDSWENTPKNAEYFKLE